MTTTSGPQQPDEMPTEMYRPGLRGYLAHLGNEGGTIWQRLRPSDRLRRANADVQFWQWAAETPVVTRPTPPSAQPDEHRWEVATEVASRYFGPQDDEYRDLLADVHAAISGHIQPPVQPEATDAVQDEQGRRCRCDGGAYEIKRHPFLVHPDCAIHRTPAQPVHDTGEGRR